jgi:glycosyltransferase involved in cell wall biosynthesis
MNQRLLLITTIPETITAFLLPFAQYFRAQGWRVDAMAANISENPDCVKNFDRVWDVNWSRHPLAPANLILAPRMIQRVVQAGHYDIVHVHTPIAAFIARWALRNRSKSHTPQLIYTSHGFTFHRKGNVLKNALFKTLEKLAGRWTDFLVVMNQEDYTAAKTQALVAAERIIFMPGIGLDLDYYHPDRASASDIAEVRQSLNLEPDRPLLLSIAELTPRKHPCDILRAFARLGRSDIYLAFAGTGPLLNTLQTLAVELGIADRVRFLGFRQDIPILIRTAIATVLASEYEGLPRCVMESMALETPVIGSAVRGTQDLLADQTDLLFQPGDVADLARAIAWVLDHPAMARLIGRQGRERMASHDLKQVIALHKQLYTRALNQRKEVVAA